MISPILPAHDADSVALDFGVFVAKRAQRYRTSQTAIIAALRPLIEPVRHSGDDRPLTPDAVDRLLKAIDELEPTPSQPEPTSLALAADASPPVKVDAATDGGVTLPPAPSVAPIQPETATLSTGASQERAQTATGAVTSGDNLGSDSRPIATAKTGVPFHQSQAPGDGQSQHNSGVRVAPVEPIHPDTGDAKFRDPTDWEDEDGAQPAPITVAGDPADGAGSSKSAPTPSAAFSPAPHPNGQPKRRTTGRTAEMLRLHAEHPDWPASKIAKEIGCTRDVIHAAASKRGIKLPSQLEWEAARSAQIKSELAARAEVETPPAVIPEPAPALPAPPKPPTRREQFRQAHAAHPEWTSKEHAAHLGISMENVCAVAKQTGITLPRAGRAKAEQAASAPTAQVQAKRQPVATPAHRVGPPAVTARHPVTAANEPRRVVPTHAPRGAGPGVKFHVRDSLGWWLHQSLEASPTDDGPLMTVNRAYAWCDTAQRFAGACRKWPEIHSMRKVGPTDV